MSRYNVDAVWDDPFEHPVNRRVAPRYDSKIKLSIMVEDEDRKNRLIGPGIARNISSTGILLRTKHQLKPGQRVMVSIPTSQIQSEAVLPESFVGNATVVRVEAEDGSIMKAALRFGEALLQNFEFSMYMNQLTNLAITRAS
ncbi:MAG: PilZ domain-containing protein [Candidatus Hydrogenedentes bacterium]|nr:PilZ domain-containing protein [Candidatus Hydrogenedentota bacterium]